MCLDISVIIEHLVNLILQGVLLPDVCQKHIYPIFAIDRRLSIDTLIRYDVTMVKNVSGIFWETNAFLNMKRMLRPTITKLTSPCSTKKTYIYIFFSSPLDRCNMFISVYKITFCYNTTSIFGTGTFWGTIAFSLLFFT